ncbi:MAG: RHS repeat-associated core domain-containing protein [Flavobacteriales bacterium]|nr:RHS repeat-associated core domain-containing protein [Flavobacteriales bacterium]
MPGRKYSSEAYRYDYQGQFAEKDGETGLHSFELRQWDARIGRWNSTDPYGQYFSPYMGMGNNPVSLVDPNGGYTKIGAWLRNGFSSKGLDQVNGEWGFYEVDMSGSISFNANGNFTTMDMNIQFNGSDGLSDLSSSLVQGLEFAKDFTGGVKDFGNQYVTMKFKTNLANSDKYFHSKANFDASRRGLGGEYAAEKMSNLREIIDQRIKGDSRNSSLLDQEANRYGRLQGIKYRNHSGPINYKEAIPKFRTNRLLDAKGL